MKKKQITLTAIATLSLTMVACGSDNTSSGAVTGGNNEVNSSTDIETDSNENTSANVPIEQETIDPRIGKTLGELMDLTAYKEECNTLDVYKDSARELSDVFPFEIYEFYNGELSNFYADGSETKTVKAASIEGTYGSVMVIKMDGTNTYDLLLRVPYEPDNLYNSCSYKDLGNYIVLAKGLNEEEVERMVIPGDYLASEYTHLIFDNANEENDYR